MAAVATTSTTTTTTSATTGSGSSLVSSSGNAGAPPPSRLFNSSSTTSSSSNNAVVYEDVVKLDDGVSSSKSAVSDSLTIEATKEMIRKAWPHTGSTLSALQVRALASKASVDYAQTTEDGTYVCACCASELFSSKDKFTPQGDTAQWPSFRRPITSASLDQSVIYSFGIKSESLHCAKCKLFIGERWYDEETHTDRHSVYSYCIALISSSSGQVVEASAAPVEQSSSWNVTHVMLASAAAAILGFVVFKFLQSRNSD